MGVFVLVYFVTCIVLVFLKSFKHSGTSKSWCEEPLVTQGPLEKINVYSQFVCMEISE